MRNQEKAHVLALEIAQKYDSKEVTGYEAAMKMAEWKEQQMIEFLKEFISYHDIVTESDVEDFRIAMKGE